MNRMKPQEVFANMLVYDAAGRDAMRSLAKPWQNKIRMDYRKILEKRYKASGDGDEAVEARVDEEMKNLAVLHNPDMAAGGRIYSMLDPAIPIEDKIGWSSVNSSIGGQWPSRRNLLRQHLIEQSFNNCRSPQVKIRNCHSISDQPGVSLHPQP